LSATLKTGNPHGASSYVAGNDNASARMRSEHDVTFRAVVVSARTLQGTVAT
jgi:hypothetical protein